MTLDEVLAPLTWQEFRDGHLGKQYLLSKDHPKRLKHLLCWNQLNEVLTHIRVSGKRVRLVKDGKDLPLQSYLVAPGHEDGSILKSRECVRHLGEGATLVVNKVDELFDEVRRLAESCEDYVRQHVGVNLYAAWRTTRGFDQHWDRHDTLILQVEGVKHWTIWAPTRQHPLDNDVEQAPRPDVAPVWDGLLEPGDVLYMPRGWWHVALPLNQPSMHLTAGFYHPTGVDLLTSMIKHAKAYAVVRRDVPHWEPREVQRAWIAELRSIVATLLDDGLIERFVTGMEEASRSRPLWFLPNDVRGSNAILTAHTRIRLRCGSRLQVTQAIAGAPSTIKVNGSEWKVDRRLLPALGQLHHNRPSTLNEMGQLIDSSLRPVLQAVVTGLMLGDVVWAEPHTVSEAEAVS